MHEFGAKQDPPQKAASLNPALAGYGPASKVQFPILQPSAASTQPQAGPGFSYGNLPVYAPRDATYVKVQTGEEFLQRLNALNHAATEQLKAQRLAAQGTLKPGPEEQKRQQDAAAQQVLKDQFGEGWGAFFWWTRGGGQTGPDSPIWTILGAVGVLNRSIPPAPYDTAPSIYIPKLPQTYPTESTR
ncbi:MAG TPA: hypothetical protein VLK84_25665 [Longimicrobium sp.]|nr:hypothetical protein [Longimicrobium sp.]